MPPSALLTQLRAAVRTAPVDAPASDPDPCGCCRLPRDQHGVQLLHRFVPPGRRVPTW